MQEVNEQVSVDRAAAGPAMPAPAETATAGAAPSQAPSDADRKLTTMSWLMVGTGAAIVLGSFLPWATSAVGNVSGVSAYLGWVTLIAGIMLGAYGYQGLRKDDPIVRHHGWAFTAVSVAFFVALISFSVVDDLGQLGGVVAVGAGLYIIMAANLFAIWPLVQLRKDGKRREAAATASTVSEMASQIAGQAPATAQAAQVQPQEAQEAAQVQPQADWYADPTSRHERRYFDGAAWTEHVVDGEAQATDPIG